jgi:hypothetical protein
MSNNLFGIQLNIRNVDLNYKDVGVICDNVKVDLGLFNKKDSDLLAELFIYAIRDLEPYDNYSFSEWLNERLRNCGIETNLGEQDV